MSPVKTAQTKKQDKSKQIAPTVELEDIELIPGTEEKTDDEALGDDAAEEPADDEAAIDEEDVNPFGDKWEG